MEAKLHRSWFFREKWREIVRKSLWRGAGVVRKKISIDSETILWRWTLFWLLYDSICPPRKMLKAIEQSLGSYWSLRSDCKQISEVAQSCLTLCDQARVLEWVAISFSRGSSLPRDRTQVSRIAGRRFITWATRDLSVDLFNSVIQSCSTPSDPMHCSTPGLPVHHQLPELIQIHVHRVGDAIPPYHPLSSPSLPAFNLSQHQGLFQWVSSSHQMVKVLQFQLQHQFFQ